MTRAYGYIYTIFGLEASHASFRASPSIKLARARWAGPNPRLANEDHCLENSVRLFCISPFIFQEKFNF